MFVWSDQVVFVTGAARGLGLEIVRQIAERGGHVIGADIRHSLLLQTLEEWAPELREKISPIDLDVSGEAAVIGAVKETIEKWGRIDGLVNNAGVRIVNPVWNLSTRDWDRVQAVNLKAQFLLTREVLKQSMRPRNQGRLIFISSLAGVRGVPRGAAYASSKWGIRGLAASIAKDLKDTKISVTCLLPGMLLTPMARESEVWELGLDWMDPASCARLVVFCMEQDPDTAIPEVIIHNRSQI